jgi:two-component system sensor kinase FixL
MFNEQDSLINDLAELFELSLGIGTSLDLVTNAETFFNRLSQRKNLVHISLWVRESNWSVKVHIPKIKLAITEQSDNDFLDGQWAELKEGKINEITTKSEFLNKYNRNVVVFKMENVVVGMVFGAHIKLTPKGKSQLNTLLNKFFISVKACLSHKALLDEVVRRNEAEFRLFERESLFRFGANSLSEGIIVTDLEDRITYVNKAMTSITGYSKEELMGAIANSLFLPKSKQEFISEVIERRKKDISETYEIEQVHKKGYPYWVRITASAFKNSKGEIVGSIATMLDITKDLKTQQEIKQNREELQSLVDTMYDGLLVLDKNGTIINANAACKTLFELKNEDIGSLNLEELVHPDDKADIYKNRGEVKERKRLETFKAKVVTRSGIHKVVEVNSSALYRGGEYIGSRDILRDITEREHLENERRLSEEKLRLIIDTALDAVITMNSRGQITEWNKNAHLMFGFTYDQVIGKRLSDHIIPHQYREAHSQGMKYYFATGEGPVLGKRIEITAIDNEEREFPIELAITPVKQGGETFFSAFIRDISARKEAEEQKEMLLSELESVNQELRDFAYVVSHDLKAPLRSIGSISDWLAQDYDDVLDDEGKNLLGLLKGRVSRMHSLIEGVLQYSKIGRLKDEKEEVNVGQLLKEVIDLLDPPVNIRISVGSDMPVIKYDRTRLQQVFQNLISNAIKFMDKDKGLILVKCVESEKLYTFSVKDNGPGIEKTYFEKIFKIFQTLKAKDEYESTGIGLSIVKRIVELNGGNITLESEIGKGSTFTFTVPK